MAASQSPPPRDKAIIYCRVSSKKQTADGAGLTSQERSGRDQAARCGYKVVAVFTDVISGMYVERPGLSDMFSFLGEVDGREYTVIMDDISRLARDVRAHSEIRDKILSYGAMIETRTQKLGTDSTSRLVENIMASVADHGRRANAEQSKSRTIGRLQNGYWVFQTSKGYCYGKASVGGKMLVRDEPLASIVTEALEGFATGRFQTQAEVKRFFESKPEFPKTFGGREVKFDRVTQILSHPIYAGYFEKPEWGVPWTKGEHEPLIALDTYLKNQERLAGRGVAPARKDIDEDFPLRGFLACTQCGYSLTSCWSQSKTGRKYPYYQCHYRGCPLKGKSIPRD